MAAPEDAPNLRTSSHNRWRVFKNAFQQFKDLIGGSVVSEQTQAPSEVIPDRSFLEPFGQKLLEQEGLLPAPNGSGSAIGAQFRGNERSLCVLVFQNFSRL